MHTVKNFSKWIYKAIVEKWVTFQNGKRREQENFPPEENIHSENKLLNELQCAELFLYNYPGLAIVRF